MTNLNLSEWKHNIQSPVTIQSSGTGYRLVGSTPSLRPSYDRIALYRSLSPIAQNLVDLLYSHGGNEDVIDNFVEAVPPSPLEEYIIAFDLNMDDDGIVRAIGSRMGLFIPISREFTADEFFVDKIVSVMETFTYQDDDEAQYPLNHGEPLPTIREMIDMSRKEFQKFVDKVGLQFSEQLYQDRLMVLKSIFETDLT